MSTPLQRILGAAAVALAIGIVAAALMAPVPPAIAAAAVAVLLVAGTAWIATALARWRDPTDEREFDAIVLRADRLAREEAYADEDDADEEDDEYERLLDPWVEEDFEALVRGAIDDLPLEFHRALEHVAVVVSDGGARRGAYGLYQGDTVAHDHFHERIVIFRDTLLRDFGHDPMLLRAQVTRTLRHELAHHLGWNERGVRGLGL